MRHQPSHIPFAITNPSNVVHRTIRISRVIVRTVCTGIAKQNLPVLLQCSDRCSVAIVIAFIVRDRNFQHLSLLRQASDRRICLLDPYINMPANIPQPLIAHHRARQQPCFQQNLKSIANPQNNPAALRKLLHRLHHRRKPRNRPGPQIIAMREPARQNNSVASSQVFRLVPDKLHRLFQDITDGVKSVVVAIRPRKNNYSKFHGVAAPDGIWGTLILAQLNEFPGRYWKTVIPSEARNLTRVFLWPAEPVAYLGELDVSFSGETASEESWLR